MGTFKNFARMAGAGVLGMALAIAGCTAGPNDGLGSTEEYVLTPNMGSYSVGDCVTINWDGFPPTSTDWLAIAAPTDPPTTYMTWAYTGGTATGSHTFCGLPAGSYEARGYYNNSFTVSQTVAFSISSATGTITTDASTYASGSPITTPFTIASPSSTDWIAIGPAGGADTVFQAWQYTGGGTSGSPVFNVTLAAGSYEARLYRNNGYPSIARSAAFTVTGGGGTPGVSVPSSVTSGTPIPVTVSNFPGNSSDWLTIATPGSAATSYLTYTYTNGVQNGVVNMNPMPAGTYEVRGYFNWPTGGYTIQATTTLIVGSSTLTAPRPVSPMSSSVATSATPTVRWVNGGTTPGASVEFCSSRDCTTILETVNVAAGTSARPTAALSAGPVFWRARGYDGTLFGTTYSPVWEIWIPASSTSIDVSWGAVFDSNGDGYADGAVGGDRANRAYTYLGSASGMATSYNEAVTQVVPRFGSALGSAGDVNGDGFSDLIVGAYGLNSNQGAFYVYHGGANGILGTVVTSVVGSDGANAFLGSVLGAAGDVNGDGYGDVYACGYGANSLAGRCYVHLGSASGVSSTPATTIDGPDGAGGWLGYSAAGAADINADGFHDIVIGAGGVSSSMGRIHVFLGSASGISSTPSFSVNGPMAGGEFGYSVAIGDANADGRSDVAVGAPQADPGGVTNAGEAYVFLATAGGSLPSTPSTTLSALHAAGGRTGLAVRFGDFDGNGFQDLAVGGTSGGDGGFVDVFAGSSSGVATTASATLAGGAGAGGFFGTTLGTGDYNRDGRWDLLAGAYGFMSTVGVAYTYAGSATSLGTSPATTISSPAGSNGRFGIGVGP